MSKTTLLTVDIGNTTIGLALLKGNTVVDIGRLETTAAPNILKPTLRKILRRVSNVSKNIEVALICSVVPECNKYVEKAIVEILGVDVKVVGRDIFVPMPNRYRNPRQVGQDRLVGAYAAMKLYGQPIIVVDLGTAITFDTVSNKGEYLGGVIAPGLRLSAESLFTKTALLPEIDIKAPTSPIGRTTQESILSGLFYGYGAMCQGMIDVLSKDKAIGKHQKAIKVVMTGGHTDIMKRFVSPKIRIIDEHLVFKGLGLLWEGVKG